MANVEWARVRIAEQVGNVVKASSVFETAAWGLREQPAFLNQVLQVSTHLSAIGLLHAVLQIEEQAGRQRLQKMGPRIIDIDILFYNQVIISLPDLKVPHPEIENRRFVLTPLNELAPQFIHPVLQTTVADLLQKCPDLLEVKKFDSF